jgi:hypothetical protein
MKFSTLLTSLVAIASTALADEQGLCGHQCDPNRVPKTPLIGKIEIVAKYDMNNPAIQYQIAGDVVIVNDCEFKVENFYMFPGVNVAKWMGCPVDANNAIALTSDGAVTAIDPNQPVTLEYDVNKANDFCKASLLDNVGEFRLVDSNYQLLARATVNSAITTKTSEEANNNYKNNNSTTTDNKKITIPVMLRLVNGA